MRIRLTAVALIVGLGTAVGQEPPLAVPSIPQLAAQSPLPIPNPPSPAGERVLPINLASALQLAGAKPLDIQIAARQVEISARALDRAKLLWVPNLTFGTDYFAHTGPQQNFAGEIVTQNRSTFMVGVGPNVIFSASDAVYAPLAARQDLRARQARLQAVTNDLAFEVAAAYFDVQQARGELAGAILAVEKAEEVSARAARLAEGLAPPLEASRARVELARRKQAETVARERWRTAGAELARLLRLDPSSIIEPIEPPSLTVTVIQSSATIDELIPVALITRPELAGQQAVVLATLARLKQEKIRPMVPSLALRSASTNPSGSLGYGSFGGGRNDQIGNYAPRFDVDIQVLWEFEALGFGNRARVGQRKAEHEVATLELFRTQDRIAAEVTAALAQVRAAGERVTLSEPALKDAIELVERSLEGLGQTRRIGDALTLVIRPQEVVAAVQSLGQANAEFHAAVGDYNRAQFRLYRALGHPAQCLAGSVAGSEPISK